MKRIVVLMLVLLLSGASVSLAAKDQKGASEQAYEHASENSIFNRVSDWFATVGKSGEEKEQILQERRAERAQKHAEKKMEKAKMKAEEKMKDAEMESEKAASRMKEKAKGMDMKKDMPQGSPMGN